MPLTLAEVARKLRLQQLYDDTAGQRPKDVKPPVGLGQGVIPKGEAPKILSSKSAHRNPSADLKWETAAWHLAHWR